MSAVAIERKTPCGEFFGGIVYNKSMSETLGKHPEQKNERKDDGEMARWEDLMDADARKVNWESIAEGEGGADWEGVTEVEFAGAGSSEGEVSTEEVVEIMGEGEKAWKAERLRGWIDLDAIAAREDPEGLAEVEREGETRRGRVEDLKVTLAEKDGRYAEIDVRREEIPGEVVAAQHELELYDRKERRSAFRGVKKALGIGAKKRAELAEKYDRLVKERDDLWNEKREIEGERASLERTIAEADVDGAKREFLEKFETPLTPEEKKEGLDFEALAELSTEEYLRLWRRLNPFFVTHVTRQGIRDHNAMIYHSAGMGEFQEGMTGVLTDEKKLRTPAEVRLGLGREITEEGVGRALDKMLFSTDVDIEEMRGRGMSDKAIVKNLVENLPVNTTLVAAEPWSDKRAVHFAQLTVLDDIYGGESGNEAFFVFPTDVIASQCRFGGHTRDNLMSAETVTERKWNDMFVWPKDEDITIDAGLTFLPANTMVDAKTGSKYATIETEVDGREVRVPVVDEEAVAKFTEWVTGLSEEDEAVKAAIGANGKFDATMLREEALRAGISERMLADLLEEPYELQSFMRGGELGPLWMVSQEELAKMTPEEKRARSVQEFLSGKASTWKLAEDAVSAQEYWEGYFREHPEQRPAHMIYYDGDPSAAVIRTLKEAGILEKMPGYHSTFGRDDAQMWTGKGDSHERDGKWLGFEDNRVVNAEEDAALQAEREKFNEIARKLVAEHYGLEG